MAYQEHYTQQLLDNLRAKLLIMGSKTQQALDDAAIAVLNHELPRAAAVLDGDTDIDDLENQIDEATLNILARTDRKSTRLNSSHRSLSRMPSSA